VISTISVWGGWESNPHWAGAQAEFKSPEAECRVVTLDAGDALLVRVVADSSCRQGSLSDAA
jgi:hypothetical protein